MNKFEEICERIKKNTNLKNNKEIAKAAGVTEPTFYEQKRNNNFQTDWAFKIGQQYEECPNWIMTGENRPNKCTKTKIAVCLGQWIEEKAQGDKDRLAYYRGLIKERLPEFNEWMIMNGKEC